MQLSEKEKSFSRFFTAFLKTISNSQHVPKKLVLIGYGFLKLETPKDLGRQMSKKIPFKTPFDSQHAKGCKTQLKSAAKHFYHIF